MLTRKATTVGFCFVLFLCFFAFSELAKAVVCTGTIATNACSRITSQTDCSNYYLSASPAMQCKWGEYCSNGGGYCTPPRAGYYVASPGAAQETACPAGTFSTVVGATSPSTCATCPANSTSGAGASACSANIGYYSNNGVITKAPPGYYAPGNTTLPIACPAGTYSPVSGTTSPGNCAPCPAGTYSLTVGAASSSVCTACPANSTSGAGASACSANPGYYSNNGVLTQASAGYYAPGNTTSQVACPSGTFSPALGVTNSGDCASCPAGTYSSTVGAANPSVCAACPTNYTSGAGASACYVIPGYFVNNGVPTRASAGYYAPGNTTSQIACPAGTYSAALGATSSRTCTPCPRDYYSATVGAASSSVCTACPVKTGTRSTGASAAYECLSGADRRNGTN